MRHREWLCLLMFLAACKGPSAPTVATPTTATVSATNKSPAPRPPIPVEVKQVRDLLGDWVGAQNEGDFSRYEAQYAPQFEAIDHTGRRPRTVKGAAWLKGQKSLFAKPQTVATRDEKVQAEADHGEIRFFRTVDSGSYFEESERLLVVQREAGTWHITREELLSKKVDPGRSSAMEDMAYALIWDDEVVLRDDVSDYYLAGNPRLRDGEWGVAVARVNEKALPNDVLAWKRERLRLIDAKLNECQATVIGFEVIAHSEFDMGTIRGTTGDNDRKAAAEVWKAKHLLIAKMSPWEGACERPLLARPARLPRGKVYAFDEASEAIDKAGTRLFNDLPEVAKLTADVKERTPDWDESPQVSLANAGKSGFFLSARNLGPTGCGEPGFYAEALWRSPTGRAKSQWELVRGPQEGKAATHEFILDDGTGKLRIVYTGDLRMGVLKCGAEMNGPDGTCVLERELEVPYLDCRC